MMDLAFWKISIVFLLDVTYIIECHGLKQTVQE